MNAKARDLLAAFDALDAADRQQVAAAILRRSAGAGDLPDATFDELAAQLFGTYDAEEAADAEHKPR